jgi:hypothetical protein
MVLQTLVSIIHLVCNLRQFKLLIEDESNSVSQPKTQQHRETEDEVYKQCYTRHSSLFQKDM